MSTEVSIWQMTEDQLLEEVTRLCEERRIRWVHIDTPHHNKRRGDLIGFPDLFLCGSHGAIFRELKKEWRGDPSPSQTKWGYDLKAAGQSWDIWQPSDLRDGRIVRELDALCR
jgi:hypothetical protein